MRRKKSVGKYVRKGLLLTCGYLICAVVLNADTPTVEKSRTLSAIENDPVTFSISKIDSDLIFTLTKPSDMTATIDPVGKDWVISIVSGNFSECTSIGKAEITRIFTGLEHSDNLFVAKVSGKIEYCDGEDGEEGGTTPYSYLLDGSINLDFYIDPQDSYIGINEDLTLYAKEVDSEEDVLADWELEDLEEGDENEVSLDPPSGTNTTFSSTKAGQYKVAANRPYDERESTEGQTTTVNVVKFDIDEAGDFIVPGSQRNTIRYSWEPDEEDPDTVILEVYDNGENLVRTIEGLPTSYSDSNDYAEYEWDGLDDDGNPLEETNAPYELRIKADWQGTEFEDEISADVKEWKLVLKIPDKPAYEDATTTGIDMDTVTTDGDLVVFKQQFVEEEGDAIKIDHIDVDESEENSTDVEVVLLRDGDDNPFIFYTSPTNLPDPSIRYELTMEVDDGGVLDEAHNPWDMDGETEDKWENKATWEFAIDQEGTLVGETVEFEQTEQTEQTE